MHTIRTPSSPCLYLIIQSQSSKAASTVTLQRYRLFLSQNIDVFSYNSRGPTSCSGRTVVRNTGANSGANSPRCHASATRPQALSACVMAMEPAHVHDIHGEDASTAHAMHSSGIPLRPTPVACHHQHSRPLTQPSVPAHGLMPPDVRPLTRPQTSTANLAEGGWYSSAMDAPHRTSCLHGQHATSTHIDPMRAAGSYVAGSTPIPP